MVAANDISLANLEELGRLGGGNIKAYLKYVAKKVGVQTLNKQVEDDFGHIDILINHAAVEPRSVILYMDEYDWHRVLDVNLTGAFLIMQSVGCVIRARGAGTMVNLIRIFQPLANHLAASHVNMAGLIALIPAVAIEFTPFNIHVHAVGTDMLGFQQDDPSIPSDLNGAVLFLSNSALYGQIVKLEQHLTGLRGLEKVV